MTVKRIFHWKSVFGLSVAFLIFLLFQVLKADFMALPDSGFSRGILLDKIQIEEGYENYTSEHFTSLVKNNELYLISSDSNGLHIKIFDPNAKLKKSFTLKEYKSFSKINAHFSGNQLVVNTFKKDTRSWLSLNISIKDQSATVEFEKKLPDSRALLLASNLVLVGTDDALTLITPTKEIHLARPQFLETLAYVKDSTDDTLWVAYTEFIDSQYQLNVKHLDKNFNTLSDIKPVYVFGSGGASKPHELSMIAAKGELQIISVITDAKSGVNTAYLLRAPKTDLKQLSVLNFNAYTYALEPHFYSTDVGTQLIIATKTNIGRVELGANGTFQNLITLDLDLKQAKSLTKSTAPALSPQMNQMEPYHYLCYLHINQGVGKIMLSSNNPILVKESLKSSLSENVNLLMTALTTFLPLSYIGLIVQVYVLTPVLVVVVLLSMFYLTWAERNGNKLLIAAILIHLAAKNYFMIHHILKSPDVFSNFPAFLDSPIKLISWGLVMSLSSIYCLINFRRTHPHSHYLFQYFFFNLLDIILFTMLFTPYYLLV